MRRGTTAARVQTRARVLDLLHREQHPTAIAATLSLSVPIVFNIKRRYLDEGFDAALQEKPRSGKPRRIPSIEELDRQVQALVKERNKLKIKVEWQFSISQARENLSRHYEIVKSKN